MKLLFDQNLAYRLVPALDSLYPGSEHVKTVGLDTASDDQVWNFARDNDFVIVSKDSDFYHRALLLGPPPKAVVLRLGNCTTQDVLELLQVRHSDLMAFNQEPNAACLLLP